MRTFALLAIIASYAAASVDETVAHTTEVAKDGAEHGDAAVETGDAIADQAAESANN